MNEYSHFVTTYRKDFLWPYNTTFPLTLGDEGKIDLGVSQRYPATCHCKVMDPIIDARVKDRPKDECAEQQWSRLGPMGALLDAKVFPVKMGASPETDSTKYDQPNAFLAKLNEKYPQLYEILRSTPEEEMLFKVVNDRMHTTYQIDYCGVSEYPAGKYDLLVGGARNKTGLDPSCEEHVSKLPDDPCQQNQRNISYRLASISKSQGQHRSGPKMVSKDCCQTQNLKHSKYTTEYRDHVSRMGGLIMKTHLHARNH